MHIVRESWQITTSVQKGTMWLVLPVKSFALAIAEPTNFNLWELTEYDPVETPVRDMSLIQRPRRKIFSVTH